jgi:hypothetical protein
LAAAAVLVLVGSWLSSRGSGPSSLPTRTAGQAAAAEDREIVCPGGQELAGTDLGRLGPGRESPTAAVADVAAAFKNHPAGVYRYRQDEQGGDWVYFLGTVGAVAKVRISVRHLDDGWVAVAISGCDGNYPAGIVDYPAERPVPALSSTSGLLLALNDPLQRRGPVAALALQDTTGRTVWELPRVGAWYPTPVSWSPDGRRFLFEVSAGQQTESRVVSLPDGRDIAVPGALTWIDDDAVLVLRDGRLSRLNLSSGAIVTGPALTQYVSSQAGTRGRAALVVIPHLPHGNAEAQPDPVFVRVVDSTLHTQDTPAPPGTVDCFSLAWSNDGRRLGLVCRRADPQAGSSDTDGFEIDIDTLRWTRQPTGSGRSIEQPLRSPASG